MSKQDNASRQRLSKKELRRQQLAREKRMKTMRVVIPAVVIVLTLAGFVAYRALRPEIPGVEQVAAAAGSQHDDTLEIAFGGLPPLGGPHNSRWQNCGIYTEPVLPQYAIHSMEHGVVWITYHPDLPDAEIAALQDKVEGTPKILLSPYPDQAEPIVLTVWDRQLVVSSADDGRIDDFIGRYRNRSGPEASSSCSNGVGVPTG